MSAISEIQGKRIFFLHPSIVVQNQVVAELAQQEYEVYVVKNHGTIRKVLKKYPDSVLFVDIEQGMNEHDWETWLRTVMSAQPELAVGIISANRDEKLIQKYTDSVKIQCGYTVIKSDINKAIAQVLEALNGINAKGRRKYIRACIESDVMATINLPHGGDFINGSIKDISVVGISCAFDTDPQLTKNALLKDIQVKLQTMLLKVEAIVFGSRMDGNLKIYVLLFTQRTDPDVRTRIRKYIQQTLQNKMDTELK